MTARGRFIGKTVAHGTSLADRVFLWRGSAIGVPDVEGQGIIRRCGGLFARGRACGWIGREQSGPCSRAAWTA